MTSVKMNNLSLKNLKFTTSGRKDTGIWKFEFVMNIPLTYRYSSSICVILSYKLFISWNYINLINLKNNCEFGKNLNIYCEIQLFSKTCAKTNILHFWKLWFIKLNMLKYLQFHQVKLSFDAYRCSLLERTQKSLFVTNYTESVSEMKNILFKIEIWIFCILIALEFDFRNFKPKYL